MTLFHVIFLGIGPAALVGLAGVYVRSRRPEKTAATLLWSGFLLLALAALEGLL